MSDLPEIEDDGDDFDAVGTDQPTIDAGNPRAVKKRRQDVEDEQREIDLFWASLMKLPLGRKIMWGLLRDCGTFDASFQCGPNGFPQPDATWFKAGQKAVGEGLYLKLSVVAREDTLRMHDEYDSRFPKPLKKRGK